MKKSDKIKAITIALQFASDVDKVNRVIIFKMIKS